MLCERCSCTTGIPKAKPPIRSSVASPRREATGFWRSSRGDVGIIFGKDDLPIALKKKVRLQNIIAKSIEKEAIIIKQRYIIKHPVIHLLEKNLNKMYANEVFLNNKDFNKLKAFRGMAMDPSTGKQPINKVKSAKDNELVQIGVSLKAKANSSKFMFN